MHHKVIKFKKLLNSIKSAHQITWVDWQSHTKIIQGDDSFPPLISYQQQIIYGNVVVRKLTS